LVAQPLCNGATEPTSPCGSTGVRATVTAGSAATAFAATDPGKLTVVLVNESASAQQTFTVQLGGYSAAAKAQWWRTQSNAAITAQPEVTVSAGSATVTLPARSIGILVVPAAAGIDAGTGTDAGGGASDGGPGSGGSDAGGNDGGAGGDPGADTVTSTCASAGPGAPSVLLLVLVLVALRRRRGKSESPPAGNVH
jgi:MYXO-CTERM domain-containing protein